MTANCTTKYILFSFNTHRLTFFQSHVIENIHFEWTTQAFILFFNKNRQTIATSLGYNVKSDEKIQTSLPMSCCKSEQFWRAHLYCFWLAYHWDMYFPNNPNLDRLPLARDECVAYIGSANNCADSSRNSPNDIQMNIRRGTYLHSPNDWRL